MKRIIKTVFLLGLSLILVSCKDSALRMPKPKGKEVTFTPLQLERKFDRLNFANKDEGYISVYNTEKYAYEDDETSYEESLNYRALKDPTRNDVLTDLTYDYSIFDGKGKLELNAYESRNYTYVDVIYDNNLEFDDEDDNFEVYNGKYKIKKEDERCYRSNTLYRMLAQQGIYIDDDLDFEDVEYYFEYDFYLELNEISYHNLKFYETDTLFTLELKITLDDLKEEKDDLLDIVEDWFGLPDDLEELEEFEIYQIFVFEKNTLVEFGMKRKFDFNNKEKDPSEFYKLYTEGVIVIKYTDKEPKEIDYADYELIDGPEDILK